MVGRYLLDVYTVTHGQTVSYPPSSPARNSTPEEDESDRDGELAVQLKSKSLLSLTASTLPLTALTSDTALYHAAIEPETNKVTTKMAVQSKGADTSNVGTFVSHCESQRVTHNHSTGKRQTKVGDKMGESNETEGKKPRK